MEYWTRLDSLPVDILVEVFCFLSCRSLSQVTLVSQALYLVTQNRSATLWRNLCYTTFGITFKDDKERLYDLNISEEVNGTQECSILSQPALSWSQKRKKRNLGRRTDRSVSWKSVFKSLSAKHRTSSLPEQYANYTGCMHYKRNCQIFTKCCNEIFPCHICHDHECGAGGSGEKVNGGCGEMGQMEEPGGSTSKEFPCLSRCGEECVKKTACGHVTCSSNGCSFQDGTCIEPFGLTRIGNITGPSISNTDICAIPDSVGGVHNSGGFIGVDFAQIGCSNGVRRVVYGAFDEETAQEVKEDLFREKRPHLMDRFAVDTMLCMKCGCMQAIGKTCCSCKAEMASYYCGQCKLWSEEEGHIYHCDKCGICRKGKGLGVDNWHCDNCGICFSLSVKPLHECQIKNGLRVTCPLCPSSQLLFYSREVVTVLPCGHAAHMQCIQQRLEAIDEGELICFTCEQQRQAFTEDDEEAKEAKEEKKEKKVGSSVLDNELSVQQTARSFPDISDLSPPLQHMLQHEQSVQQQQEHHTQLAQLLEHTTAPPTTYVENIQLQLYPKPNQTQKKQNNIKSTNSQNILKIPPRKVKTSLQQLGDTLQEKENNNASVITPLSPRIQQRVALLSPPQQQTSSLIIKQTKEQEKTENQEKIAMQELHAQHKPLQHILPLQDLLLSPSLPQSPVGTESNNLFQHQQSPRQPQAKPEQHQRQQQQRHPLQQQFYSNYGSLPESFVGSVPYSSVFPKESLYINYRNYNQDNPNHINHNFIPQNNNQPINSPNNPNNHHPNNSNHNTHSHHNYNIDNFNTRSTTYSNSNSPIGSRNWSGNYNKKMVTTSRPVRIDRQRAQCSYHGSSSSSASCSPPSSPKIFSYGENLSLPPSPSPQTSPSIRPASEKKACNSKIACPPEQTSKPVCVHPNNYQEPNVFELPDQYFYGGISPQTSLAGVGVTSSGEWRRGSRVCCFGGM